MQKFINSTINFIDQIDWHEIGQAIIKAIAFTYTLGYCLGLWVHRTNAQLSAVHLAVLRLKPTTIVEESSATEPALQPQLVMLPAPVGIIWFPDTLFT